MIDSTLSADNDLNKLGYTPKLFRTLNVWQLASNGLTYLQPIGPAVVFGFLLTASHGTVALPYLFAFVGMIFTVMSYSTLIQEYPLSGSVYNYAKIVIGPFFGFIAGWLLALDYILIPTITSASAAIYAHQLIPSISYEAWLITFVLSMGFVNLIGIKSSTFFSSIMLMIQLLIVILGFAVWINFIVNTNHSLNSLISMRPFHFDTVTGVIQASAIAIFSFLGFDAITTLAEESINPRKDIPRAMLICTCIGFSIMFITGYLGVLAMPNWNEYASNPNWTNAALFELAKMTGGDTFALIYTLGFILAMVTCNLVGTTAVTRLLYGMGRDRVIPQRLFGAVNKRWKTPHGNIIFIVLLELLLGSLVNLDQLAELINYGALSAFIILNFCVVCLGYKLLYKRIELKSITTTKYSAIHLIFKFLIFPMIALSIMISIFINMKNTTILFGSIWTITGISYYVIRGRLFN